MVTYGKGGWTWSDVYNMPTYLRTYYMNLLTKSLEKENGNKTSSSKVLSPPKVK